MEKKALEALMCPQCNGEVQLDDNQEYGFCKYCGVKVQNTNFKKIKSEIKILNSPTAENYMKLASRDFEDGNYKEALDNYNNVLGIEPDNWEAIYKRGVCITKTTNFADFRVQSIIKASKNALSIIENSKKYEETLNQIKMDMGYEIVTTGYSMYQFAMNHYNECKDLEDSASEMWEKEDEVLAVAKYAANLLEEIDGEEIKTTNDSRNKREILVLAYDLIILCCTTICKTRTFKRTTEEARTWIKDEYRNKYIKVYDEYVLKLKEIVPEHEIEEIERKGYHGCYVATCVYGSYNCPQVWTLRRYRDYTLSKTWYGRVFIRTYYAISPKIVNRFGNCKLFKKIFKSRLDKMVNKLQNKGYDSSPYNDKNW